MAGKAFTNMGKKKNKKFHPFSDWDCHTGNPVKNTRLVLRRGMPKAFLRVGNKLEMIIIIIVSSNSILTTTILIVLRILILLL